MNMNKTQSLKYSYKTGDAAGKHSAAAQTTSNTVNVNKKPENLKPLKLNIEP